MVSALSNYEKAYKFSKMSNIIRTKDSNGEMSVSCKWNGQLNGYWFYKYINGYGLMTLDLGEEIELICWNEKGELQEFDSLDIKRRHLDIDSFMSEYPEVITHIDKVAHSQLWSSLSEVAYIGCGVKEKLGRRLTWAYERKLRMEKGLYSENADFLPFYVEQNEMKEKVIKTDCFSDEINFIGGVDVAYNEDEQRMIGAIVVLDSKTLETIEESYHEMDITFPYVPGLFSFRETPSLIEAYNKLTTKPDVIVCDGHGIAHPKGVGMATHLGIKLDIPTIGCAKKRLIGIWNQGDLGTQKGSQASLIWEGTEVGKVLRTSNEVKPMFVSIGHKISIESATSLVLKLCSNYRLPETTRKSDQLVNKLMKERIEIDFLDSDESN